jgi:hypothetical protein
MSFLSSFLLEASLFPTALCPQEGQNLFVASNRLPHAEQNMLIFNIKALKDIILLSFDKIQYSLKQQTNFRARAYQHYVRIHLSYHR